MRHCLDSRTRALLLNELRTAELPPSVAQNAGCGKRSQDKTFGVFGDPKGLIVAAQGLYYTASRRRTTTVAFCPPKPKALAIAVSTRAGRGWLGT